MSIQYHVYANDLDGGPIDYTTPIATLSGLTYAPTALPFSSDASFAVRAFDSVSGLEEKGVTAVVRIITDAAGVDVTNRPGPPQSLRCDAKAGGTATVVWSYPESGRNPLPTVFRVYLTAGSTVNFSSPPVASVNFNQSAGRMGTFTANLTGLSDGTTYAVGVRAENTSGREQNTNQVLVIGKTSGPGSIEELVGATTSKID